VPLLEREGLLDELGTRLRAAVGGRGSLVLLGAEAGAGKTAVVTEFGHRHGQRAHVLFGGCDPLTTPRPLSPLVDIAVDPRSHLSATFAASAEPYELFTAIQRRMADSDVPLVLVIEDVHWADEGTLDFLRFIGRRIAGLPSLVVATYRDDEVGPRHPARPVIGELTARPSVRLLSVPPLSLEAVTELAGGDAARAARVHRATDGNAFYVTEVLASGEEVPRTVREAVLARAARLGESARRVVEVVATAPRSLELTVALEVAQAEPSAADEAVAAGVLLAERGHLRFRHELARGAIEAVTPLGRQFAWHRAMVDLLQRSQPDDLARLAHHAARAHAWDLFVRFAPLAARQAAERGAHREAAQFLRLALEREQHLDRPTAAALWAELAYELHVLDLHAEALTASERAVGLRRELGDPEELALALGQLGHARFRAGLDDQVAGPIGECLKLLRDLPDSLAKARAYDQAAMVSMLQRHYRPAVAAAEAALEMARRLGDARLEGRTMIMLGTTEIVMGDARRAVGLLREAHGIGERVGAPDVSRLATWMLGSGAGEARLYDEAEEALAAMVASASDTDDDSALAYGVAWRARVAFERGAYDEAVRLADRVPPRPGHGIIGPITALGAKGRTMVRRGEAGAEEVLRQALAVSPRAAMQYLWSPYCGLAELAWLEGREAEIPELLAPVMPQVTDADSPWARGEVSLWSWQAGAMAEPLPGSAEPFAALVRGDWRRSARLWGEIGCPYERAFALAHGDEDAMREALVEFRRLGAAPAAARLAARMRQLGLSHLPRGPRRVTRRNPAQLTPRQVEVLELMVAGLTNAEIAQRLDITEKTAEHHVSAVLAKLGAPNRARAVATAVGLGLVPGGEDLPPASS
jgi:DNA-binding CsgD family transcriptional regulator/tetratricopeptide (TPR) repeat protein